MRSKVDVEAASRDYLQGIQSNVYSELGVRLEDLEALNTEQLDALEQEVSEGRFPSAMPSLPKPTIDRHAEVLLDSVRGLELLTPYENRVQHAQIRNHMDGIDEAAGDFRAQKEGKEVDIEEFLGFTLVRPTVGTLPTGRLYPMRVRVPTSGQSLVLVDNDLFNFGHLLSKVLARALPQVNRKGELVRLPAKPKALLKRLKKDRSIAQRFQELMLAYLVNGSPYLAPQYYPQPPYDLLGDGILKSFYTFVLGHEYVRNSREPHESSKDVVATLGGDELVEITWSARDETAADADAMILCEAVGTWLPSPPPMWFLGAQMLHQAVIAVSRSLSILVTGSDEWYNQRETGGAGPEAKPPEMYRSNVLNGLLGMVYGPVHTNVGLLMGLVMDAILDQTRPFLVAGYEAGLRPHPRWENGNLLPPAVV